MNSGTVKRWYVFIDSTREKEKEREKTRETERHTQRDSLIEHGATQVA